MTERGLRALVRDPKSVRIWPQKQMPAFRLTILPDADLEACIFPDLSSIDSWGLTYHAYGTIRGIDLSTVLRYHKPH